MVYRMLLNSFFRLELKIFILKMGMESYWNDTFNANSHNLDSYYKPVFLFVVFNALSSPYLYCTDEDTRAPKDQVTYPESSS